MPSLLLHLLQRESRKSNRIFSVLPAVVSTFLLVQIAPNALAFDSKVDVPAWTPDVNKAIAAADYQSRIGCPENWRNFYWAKLLPPQKLLVACMTDGNLIVAPRVGTVDGSKTGTEPFNLYSYYNELPMEAVIPTKSGGHDKVFSMIISYAPNGRAFTPEAMLRNLGVSVDEKPPISFTSTRLHGGYSQRSGQFCGWPQDMTTAQVLKQRGPFICGQLREGRFTPSSIGYADDETSSVLVRLSTAGKLPSDFDPTDLYKKLKSFTSTFRIKQ